MLLTKPLEAYLLLLETPHVSVPADQSVCICKETARPPALWPEFA